MKTCGTSGKCVVDTLASSGRLRAAAMNFSTFCVRKERSCLPDRSSMMKLKPPDEPTPGIEGGEKANTCASGNLDNSLFRWARIAGYVSALFVRSSHGFRVT